MSIGNIKHSIIYHEQTYNRKHMELITNFVWQNNVLNNIFKISIQKYF